MTSLIGDMTSEVNGKDVFSDLWDSQSADLDLLQTGLSKIEKISVAEYICVCLLNCSNFV